MRRIALVAALFLLIPIAVAPTPVTAVPGGTPLVHLEPDHLPSCTGPGGWQTGCGEYGAAVATDGEIVVIGAPAQPQKVGNVTTFGVGAVHVYQEDESGWVGEEIYASNAAGWARFGSSVAADGGRFVVGARSAGAKYVGKLYFFEQGAGGAWKQAILDPADAGNYDTLGREVAISGSRIAASAWDGDVGVVYLFEESGGAWTRTQRFTTGDADDSFGSALDMEGDRIVVGDIEGSGRVFVYDWTGASWDRQTLDPPGNQDSAFGGAVAVDGDTVFVGDYYRTEAVGDGAGAVFAYTWTGSAWADQKITPKVPVAWQFFGYSVAADDGLLIVGAPYNNQDTTAQGGTYAFRRPRGVWVEEALPEVAPAQTTRNLLGSAVAVGGNIVLSGAPETKFVLPGSTTYYGHGFAFLYRSCARQIATLVGTPGDDVLAGTLGNDVIAALAGDDSINASRGHDLVCAGPGRDRVKAGAGKDIVYGESGNDLLYGNAHDDLLFSGDGIDALFGMAGNDALDGGAGRDVATFPTAPGPVTGSLAAGTATGDGSDTLSALEVLVGGRFDDHLTGDAGGNRLVGRDGNDTLLGGDGKDVLSGGRGDDTLDGQGGDDSLYGGPGSDSCIGETQDGCSP